LGHDRPIIGYFAGLVAFFFGFSTCGFGGVLSIRRNTSSSMGEGVVFGLGFGFCVISISNA